MTGVNNAFCVLQKAKFEEKAKLMQAGLSELIDTPLTTVGGSERNRTSEGITTTDDFRDVIESSLRKVETKKKREIKRNQKLSEELKRAQEENEELRNRLNDLERQQQNEQVTTCYMCIDIYVY